MKDWKNELTKIESLFGHHTMRSWRPIMKTVHVFMTEYPDNIELNIRVIYIIHNILLEEMYPDDEQDLMSDLLKKYFDESYQKFSEDPEYLFFIGEILHIAEWYFGIDEEMKPVEETLAFHMQKRAFEKEPNNKLYKWAYLFSKDHKKEAFILSENILYDESKWLDWLKTKGFSGTYLIESLEFCYKNYGKLV